MPSAERHHVVIHLYAERIDVDIVLIHRDLGIDRVDLVLGLLLELQQFGDLGESLAIHDHKIFSRERSGTAEGTHLRFIIALQIGLCRQMELCSSLEGLEHRYHILQVRNHGQQFVYIHIQHVVVQTDIEVVLPRGAVHGR